MIVDYCKPEMLNFDVFNDKILKKKLLPHSKHRSKSLKFNCFGAEMKVIPFFSGKIAIVSMIYSHDHSNKVNIIGKKK